MCEAGVAQRQQGTNTRGVLEVAVLSQEKSPAVDISLAEDHGGPDLLAPAPVMLEGGVLGDENVVRIVVSDKCQLQIYVAVCWY